MWGLHPHDLLNSQGPYLQTLLHKGLGSQAWVLRRHKHSAYGMHFILYAVTSFEYFASIMQLLLQSKE